MAGTVIPQVVTEDRASGAFLVDGSLTFDFSQVNHLSQTFGSTSNKKVFTYSFWTKRSAQLGLYPGLINVGPNSQTNGNFQSYFDTDDLLIFSQNVGSFRTDQKFSDIDGWYHIVIAVDTTQSVNTDRIKLYVNGERVTAFSHYQSINPNHEFSLVNNSGTKTEFGGVRNSAGNFNLPYDGHMAQFHFIDSQQLGPEVFGFTDPLTNTWRPKKYNKSSPNNGTTWSSSGSSSASLQNGSWGQVFDGTQYMYSGSGASNGPALDNGSITFAPSGLSGRVITAGVRGGSNKTYTVNGQAMTFGSSNAEVATIDLGSTQTITSVVGTSTASGTWAQFYWIAVDGVLLVDGLNESKAFGKNGSYLPLDGNTPIGKDQSGRGNDWKPEGFGSNSIDKATGARPILNTVNGGNVARPGVFGSDENATYKTTSASNSGGQYVFEGLGTRPNFSFVRGATYTFDWSASSSHPLRFATQADAANSSGYTNGTSVSGNVTTITVPHNAPDTLYYYCNVHNGMGNSISVTTDETKADPYAWKCVLALPLVGDDDDESKNINATQSAAKAVSPNGNAQKTFLKSNFYGGSFVFDGSGDYLSIPASSDFRFGGDDYTIEWWMYWENRTGYQSVYDCGYTTNSGSTLIQSNTSTSRFIVYAQGANVAEETTNAPLDKWIHYAFVRNGNNVTLYRDGSISYAGTHSGTNHGSSSSGVRIGSDSNNYHFEGNIQDFRIYKGVAKYTSEFTPASTKPDILPDSPSGVPTKTKLTKITDGSVNFDGSGDYLYVAPSNDWNLGTNAFTLEAYINLVEAGLDQEIFNLGLDGTHSTGADMNFRLRIAQNERLYAACHSGTSVIGQCYDASGKSCNTGRWYHVAYVRDGNNFATFIDGVRIATATSSASCNWNNAWGVKIGYAHAGGAQNFKGKISNARIVNGTALYDPTLSRVEIPTSPLTNVTNTKLLCCQSNSSAVNYAVSPGTITANGNAAPDNFNPFNTDISTVRGPESGYCVFDTLRERTAGYDPTFREGNLLMDGRGDGTGTLIATSGKYYFEVSLEVTNSNNQIYIGIMEGGYYHTERTWTTGTVAALRENGSFYGNYSTGSPVSYGNGDLLSFAYDADDKKLYIAKNGVYLNNAIPSQGIGWCFNPRFFESFTPLISDANTGQKFRANFGQTPFRYTPPDGFEPLALSTIRRNSIITRPDQYVGLATYRGTGTSSPTKSLTLGFKPDLLWCKVRTATSNNFLIDTVRTRSKVLSANLQNQQSTCDANRDVVSFDPFGFTVGQNNQTGVNENNQDILAWGWKAGGNKNTFNKDDVGYASANGVLLNAGAQDNIKFNSSEVWSSRVSGSSLSGSHTPVNAFDGDSTTNAIPADGTTQTFTPTNPITGTFTFRYERSGSGALYINGVDQNVPVYSGDPGGTYTFTGTLSSFAWKRVDSSNQIQLKQVTLDGKILRDSNLPSVPTVPATACSIGTKQGFSIIQYTGNGNAGTQIGHGLNQTPDMIIVKALERTSDWCIYTSMTAKDQYLKLGTNGTDEAKSGAFWNNTYPDDVAFSLNSSTDVNGNNESYIAYCWHNVPGMQKFGQFKGNGDADGPHIVLGFRPKILWIKRTQDDGFNWNGYDSTRGTIEGVNPANDVIRLNINNPEEPSYNAGNIYILSNGFKIKGNWANINASGKNFIYCAWAEAPIANLYGAQGNAR